ncbi:MAG: 2-amino-4-hydroxy-6-hydroxymethyldihydropteridine diphosphokinase [Thiolinea sp.]
MMARSYIGLGSNLGDGKSTLESALTQLNNHPALTLLQHSRFYSSKPHGPQNQPDYVNAVACLETTLPAIDLLQVMFAIEHEHGRQRNPQLHWGPRTLDLDLLLYNNEIINTPDLKVPHPYLCERSFVVYPLAELEPDLVLPGGKKLHDCKKNLPGDDLFVLA